MANILFFYEKGVLPNIGGIGRITYTLGKLFREHGHQVWFAASKKGNAGSYDENQIFLPNEKASEEECYQFILGVIRDNKIGVLINQNAPDSPHAILLNRIKSLMGNEIKLINCFHSSVLTPAYNFAYQEEYRLRKKKLTVLFHVLRSSIVNKILVSYYIKRYRPLYLLTVDKADLNIVLNEGQKEELQKMIGKAIDRPVSVVPNCVQITTAPTQKKENVVFWCGNFSCRIKRPDLMIDIWNSVSLKYPDWTLVMAGDGPDYEEMKKYAVLQKTQNIRFTGRVDTAPYYEKAKVFCVTSTQESFSLVAVEAMQHQAPVVLFNSFTMAPCLIDNESNGFLIKAFDVVAFCEALKRLMTDEKLRIEMGQQAARSVQRFDMEQVYKAWDDILQN